MIHYGTQFRGRKVWIRDIEERDVEPLVQYWHHSPPAFLKSLGVDLSKLKTPEETRRRFQESIPRGAAPRSCVSYIVESEKTLIAYTNLNVHALDEAYAHFHVLAASVRARAVCYVLFPKGMQIFFDTVPVNKIFFQTSPENQNVKRMLESFGLKCHQMCVDAPDGMARPGLFNVYEIDKRQAASLARSTRAMARKYESQ